MQWTCPLVWHGSPSTLTTATSAFSSEPITTTCPGIPMPLTRRLRTAATTFSTVSLAGLDDDRTSLITSDPRALSSSSSDASSLRLEPFSPLGFAFAFPFRPDPPFSLLLLLLFFPFLVLFVSWAPEVVFLALLFLPVG